MKEFIKYLLKNPGKIAWLLFIVIFYSVFNIYCWNNLEGDNKGAFITFILFFDIVALPLSLYHPYKEWKDGL